MLHSAPNFVPASPDRAHRFESRTDESCRDLDRFMSVPPPMHLDANIAGDDLPAIPRLARAAEAMGIAGLWFNEIAHDPFLGSALAAEHTSRAAIGTAIALAFVRSPTSLAYLAWDLARLSGGRFILGLGTQVRAHAAAPSGSLLFPFPDDPVLYPTPVRGHHSHLPGGGQPGDVPPGRRGRR